MYNYFENVKNDVRENLENYYTFDEIKTELENGNRAGLEDDLNSQMWTDDAITGNGSGSYTFSTFDAEENLSHNWEEILKVAGEFGYEPIIRDSYEFGPEWWDVTIRCYYLSQAISEVLDEIENDL